MPASVDPYIHYQLDLMRGMAFITVKEEQEEHGWEHGFTTFL